MTQAIFLNFGFCLLILSGPLAFAQAPQGTLEAPLEETVLPTEETSLPNKAVPQPSAGARTQASPGKAPLAKTPKPVAPSPTLPAPVPEALPVEPIPPEAPIPVPPLPSQQVSPAAVAKPNLPTSAAPQTKPVAKAGPLSGKLAELNLSPEQIQQIVEIRRQTNAELEKKLQIEWQALKLNLAQVMGDSTPSEEVRMRFDLVQKKYLELQVLKFERLLRIREVLTPEQRKKFAELRAARSNGQTQTSSATLSEP